MKKLILTSGVILAIAGHSAIAAPQQSSTGDQKAAQATVQTALSGVSPIEMPAEAAKLVLRADESKRGQVAAAVINYVGKKHPNALIQTLSAISQNQPKLAPKLVSAIIDQNPKLAQKASVAASQAAPSNAHRVAAAAAKKSPKEAVKIGTSVSEVVPNRRAMIRLFVVSEVPEASSLVTSSTSFRQEPVTSSLEAGSISFGQDGGGGGTTETGEGISGDVLSPVGQNAQPSGKQTFDPVTQQNLTQLMQQIGNGQTPERALGSLYASKAQELRAQGRANLAARVEALGSDFAFVAQANRELDDTAPANLDAPAEQRIQQNVADAVATLTQISDLANNVTSENENEVSDAIQAIQQSVEIERRSKEQVVQAARASFNVKQALKLSRQIDATDDPQQKQALQDKLQQQQLSQEEQEAFSQAQNAEKQGKAVSSIAKSIVDSVKQALEQNKSVSDAVQDKVDDIKNYASP